MSDYPQKLFAELEKELHEQHQMIAKYTRLCLSTTDPRERRKFEDEIERCEEDIDFIKKRFFKHFKERAPDRASEAEINRGILDSELRAKKYIQEEKLKFDNF